MRRACLALLLCAPWACADPGELAVAFEVRLPIDLGEGPLDRDPLLGADRVKLAAYRGADPRPVAESSASPGAPLALDPLPLGEDFALELRAYRGRQRPITQRVMKRRKSRQTVPWPSTGCRRAFCSRISCRMPPARM